MIKREIRLVWNKLRNSFRYSFPFGVLTGFLTFALSVIKYGQQTDDWHGTPLITKFYQGIIYQLDWVLKILYFWQIPKLFLLGILCLLIYKKWAYKLFSLWFFVLGIVVWSLFQAYSPENYFNFGILIDNPKHVNLVFIFNSLTLILLSYLSLILFFLLGKFFIKKAILRLEKIKEKERPKKLKAFTDWLSRLTRFELHPTLGIKKIEKENSFTPELSDNPLKSVEALNHIRNTTKDQTLFSLFDANKKSLLSLITESRKRTNGVAQAICLDGSWGSGKTSLVNIVKESLDKEPINPDTKEGCWIKFYPWSYNSGDELINDFFKILDNNLQTQFGEYLKSDFRQYAELITPVTESIGIPKSVSDLLKKLLFFKKENLNDIKESIRKRLEKIDGEIVIVVDDVDRLYYNEAILVFKLIRQNLDFSNILFILPFDYVRVSELITSQPGNCELYREYLGKIINYRLRLEKYSYRELESIFITYCLDGIKALEISRKTLSVFNIKKSYEDYVMERTSHLFSEQRIKQDKSAIKSALLKPFFSFYEPVFRLFIGHKYSYPAEYKEFKGELVDTITRHSSGESPNLKGLIINLFQPIKLNTAKKDLNAVIYSKLVGFCEKNGLPAYIKMIRQ